MEISRPPDEDYLPNLALDTKIPAKNLARRGAISFCSSNNYVTRPRSERRGGISFEKTDKNALYVRMLGDVVVRNRPDIAKDRRHSILSDADYKLIESLESSDNNKPRCGLRFASLHRTPRRHRPRLRCSPENASILDEIYTGQTKCLLSTVGNWDFNIFTLDKLTNGRPLFYLVTHLLVEHGLIKRFNLDMVRVMRCITMIEESYHSNNPYHHAVHAADVTQAMHCYLQEDVIGSCMTPLEIMLAILSASAHDIDHPGVNQGFLIATKNHLADLYQNRSVLENHHWRTAMGIIHESGIFNHFDAEEWKQTENQLRSLILATDITRQQEFLRKFKKLLDNQEFRLKENESHRHFVLQIALKCADICNVCRPWDTSKKWSHSVCKEFFQQGEYERKLGLPVTPQCDRNITSVAKIQSGFIQHVVHPLFQEWIRFLPTKLSRVMLANLHRNRDSWEVIKEQHMVPPPVEKIEELVEKTDMIEENEKENSHVTFQFAENEKTETQTITFTEEGKLDSDEDAMTSNSAIDNLGDMISETHSHYELEADDSNIDIPIRLKLRRHSLPPNVPKVEECNIFVRRQSFPHVGSKQSLNKLMYQKTTSYQGIAAVSDFDQDGNRSASMETLLGQRPRITSLSPSVEAARLTGVSPTPELQKYLSTRRASFPLQRTISKTTYTTARLSLQKNILVREPLAQIHDNKDKNRTPLRSGRPPSRSFPQEGSSKRDLFSVFPERLREKRFSDPGATIPPYLLRALEMRAMKAQEEGSSESIHSEASENNRTFKPSRLLGRRLSLEGSQELLHHGGSIGK
ncbi:high affinity 3',5'-cyclic-AMP phosphodiesterase 7A-like isoform X3 [Lineus longissimus]|uniref:high affinity 3',5'-cyclic-AMP phosphodiesterase 7A-like isoform X3 n=1 Tax=Lineus longissimus TaxID=88925 RepID=UPI00315CFA67